MLLKKNIKNFFKNFTKMLKININSLSLTRALFAYIFFLNNLMFIRAYSFFSLTIDILTLVLCMT
jgi:hypothetical protein